MNKPFLLKPSGKDYLWGGNRINDDFGKEINLSPLAESWECSVHEDGPSFVASGEHEGKSLKEVLDSNPEYLGTKHNQFPVDNSPKLYIFYHFKIVQSISFAK